MASSSSRSRSQTIAELSRRLREIQRRVKSPESRRPQSGARSQREAGRKSGVPHRLLALDSCLLSLDSFERGALVEWLAEGDGSGAGTLAFMAAMRAQSDGGALVVIDGRGDFYPPAAAAWGLELGETIIVRPSRSRDMVWALEQSLRCGGVSAVLCWADELNALVFRRLQLAAAAGGTLGLLIRPADYRGHPSWADVRLLVRPLLSQSESQGRRLHLELLHCRNGMSGGVVELDISDETGVVRVASQLGPSEAAKRKAGA